MLKIFGKSFAVVAIAFSAIAAVNAQTVKGAITIPGLPTGVAVNYVTNRVYVAVPSFGGATDTLTVINGKTDGVISNIKIPPVGFAVAVDVVRNVIYVGGQYTDANSLLQTKVAVINGNNNKVTATIPISSTQTGFGIQGLAVNPVTGELYVANANDNVLHVINYGSKTISRTIDLDGQSPGGVTVNPVTNTVYVALFGDLVDVINGKTKTITTSAAVPGANLGVAVNWLSGGNVFVTNNTFGPGGITSVLNSAGAVLATLSVGNTPYGVDVDLVRNLAYETNTGDQTLYTIDGATNTIKSVLPVDGQTLAVNPVTGKVYVASSSSNVVTIVTE